MSGVKLYNPADLDQDEWRQLQGVERDAFANTLVDRSPDEVDALVEWDNPDLFYASHIDPNGEVGKRYYQNQSHTKPRVAVATEGGELVGFAYSTHNVSGETEREQRIKRLSIVKNYLWLREIAVKPENQRQGVAKKLGETLLKDAISLQPVAAYVWPDEDHGYMQGTLERLGFSATGEQPVKVFGESSEPTKQVRMQAPSARNVLKRLG
jgi:ribosomal protein S18 acetylase RimI-like enzyme